MGRSRGLREEHSLDTWILGSGAAVPGQAVYVNYTSDEGDDVIKAAYAANVRERLVALKNKYDPTNLFRLNQNIKPTV
jgi:hypothetical protein